LTVTFTGLMLALVSSHSVAANSAPAKIAEIRIEGNQQMSESAVMSHLRSRAGAEYDEEIIKADERRLLATGRFDSVVAKRTYTGEGVVVVFTVIERPLVAEVGFRGNAAFDDQKLNAELTYGPGEGLNRYSIEAGRQAIANLYRGKGYHFATIEVDTDALESARQVIYTIEEGPQTAVRKIRLVGNKHFTGLRLRQAMGSSARIWPIVAGHLDVEQIERDVQTIVNLYIADGYLDVKVVRQIDFSDDKTKAEVTFQITEGPRFRVNKPIFEGNTVFSDQELAGRIQLRQGVFFTALRLRRDLESLERTYGELGYIEADVTAVKRFLDPTAQPPEWARSVNEGEPALLNVVFRIREADQFRIGKIDIRGNTQTQGRVIRRELRFYPEQLLNMVAVDESQRRLMETRLFEKVAISPVGKSPKVRDVLVEVDEQDPRELLFGVGISSNSGLLGTVSLTHRNFDLFRWPNSFGDLFGSGFTGAGQTLRIVAEPGVDLMRFHIDWFEPRLFDKPYSLGTKAFVFTRERENYDETRYGGVMSFGHRFKNRWYGEVASRVEGVNIDNLDVDSPPEVTEDAGTHTLLGMKGTLIRDRTDSRWMPSAGDRIRFSYEQVVGDYQFGRATGDYRIYRTVYVDTIDRKHIVSARLAGGSIFGDAPVFEKFYGGGLGSVRGFQYRGISPRSEGTDEPIGGDFMVFAGVEYGFPIVGEQLRGVVFVDSGTVEENVEVTVYRASAGVGLRWIIPMFGPVPMSLDFAFPMSKDGDDEEQVLSFTFGWTF